MSGYPDIPRDPPRVVHLEYLDLLLRADPGFRTRPELEYEFSGGRKFYDRPVDPNDIWNGL